MKSLIYATILFLLPVIGISQSVEIDLQMKMTNLTLQNTADSIVVVLADGTLARRDVSSLEGAIQVLSISNDTIFLSGGGFIKLPADLVDDADADAANELQTISKNGNTVTLSNNGGSFTDAVDDADADASNELQTISKDGNTVTLSNSGGSFIDAVDDADADASNELQTITKDGNTVTLSNNGGSFTDAVDDADSDSTNELQSISINTDTLRLSDGGYVLIPNSTDQLGNHMATQNLQLKGNYISSDGDDEGILIDNEGNVAIGSPSADYKLDVNGTLAFRDGLYQRVPVTNEICGAVQASQEGFDSFTNSVTYQAWTPLTAGFFTNFEIFVLSPGTLKYSIYRGQDTGGTLLYTSPDISFVEGWNVIQVPIRVAVQSNNPITIGLTDYNSISIAHNSLENYPLGTTNLGGDLRFRAYVGSGPCNEVAIASIDNSSGAISLVNQAINIESGIVGIGTIGKVGIGHTAPKATLDIAGQLLVSKSTPDSTDILMGVSEIKLHNTGREHWSIQNVDTSGFLTISKTSQLYDLGTPGSDVIVLSPTQNIGLGRTPTTNKLEVEGDASKSSAGDWLANSDARLKTNITKLTLINYYN